MARDFIALANELLAEIDEPEVLTGSFETPTSNEVKRVKNYINIAYRKLYTYKRQGWSWATNFGTLLLVAGQQAYGKGSGASLLPLDCDLQRLFSVRAENYSPARIMDWASFELDYGYQPSNAVQDTSNFVVYAKNDQLNFYPIPQSSKEVTYACARFFQPLALEGDEPLIPEIYRDALFWGALVLLRNREHELESEEKAQYKEALNEMVRGDGQVQNSYRIRSGEEVVNSIVESPLYDLVYRDY